MSKYEPLWIWIKKNRTDSFKLTYDEIEKITGFPIDHAFLKYKKELLEYGFSVEKIPCLKKERVLYLQDMEVVEEMRSKGIGA